MAQTMKNPNSNATMTYITVDMARGFLETNARNRTLTTARVNEYAELMRLGMFMTTHQGIAFDKNGSLIDGQHRLAAIVSSGLPQLMYVFTGLEPECKLAIDSGKVRTPMAISKISGRTGDSERIFAIVKKLQFGVTRSHSAVHVNEQVLFALVDKFERGIGFLTNCKGGLNLPSAVSTVIVKAFYSGISRDVLIRFCEILSGDLCSKDETSAQRMRELLIRSQSSRHTRRDTVDLHNCAETALHAFVNGKALKKITPTTTEYFELPLYLEASK